MLIGKKVADMALKPAKNHPSSQVSWEKRGHMCPKNSHKSSNIAVLIGQKMEDVADVPSRISGKTWFETMGCLGVAEAGLSG